VLVLTACINGATAHLERWVACAGDERTAQDTYTFLQGFFKRFPQFAGRPFWVTGESYGVCLRLPP